MPLRIASGVAVFPESVQEQIHPESYARDLRISLLAANKLWDSTITNLTSDHTQVPTSLIPTEADHAFVSHFNGERFSHNLGPAGTDPRIGGAFDHLMGSASVSGSKNNVHPGSEARTALPRGLMRSYGYQADRRHARN
jgi:hypothetical protein